MRSIGLGELQMTALAVGVGALAYMVWRATKAVGEGALDPTSSNNLAARGVNSVGAAVTGDTAWNLGSSLYELTNPGRVAAERAVTAPPLQHSGAALLFGNDLEKLSARGRIYASQAAADAEFSQGHDYNLTPGGM